MKVGTAAVVVAAMTGLYAVAGTPLQEHADSIVRAIERALVVRAQAVAAPGTWQTDRDGQPVPKTGVTVIHIGGNGGG